MSLANAVAASTRCSGGGSACVRGEACSRSDAFMMLAGHSFSFSLWEWGFDAGPSPYHRKANNLKKKPAPGCVEERGVGVQRKEVACSKTAHTRG